MHKIRLIACSSAVKLATDISQQLALPLTKYESRKFANTETRIVLGESVRGKKVFIIGTGFEPVNDAVMEIYLLACDCRDSGAKHITLVMPHYSYARCERKDAPRAPISARYVTDMYNIAGIRRIVAVDLHAGAIQGFANFPYDNLYGTIVLKPFLNKLLFENDPDYRKKYVAVAPDAGGYKRTSKYASTFDLPFISMEKERDHTKEGVVNKSVIHGNTDIHGKVAIIFDDICDTGGTINAAAAELKERGATEVIVCVTHALLSGKGFDLIKDSPYISRFICSDSVPQADRQEKCKKMSVFTLAPLLAEVIKRTADNRSNSDLFE